MVDGRRFLLATAVARYRHAPRWDRPELAGARRDIVDLFTGSLGYTHVEDLGLDPARDQLTSRLRAFCRSPRLGARDMVAIYLACHGEILDTSGEHVLLTSEPTRTTSPTPCHH